MFLVQRPLPLPVLPARAPRERFPISPTTSTRTNHRRRQGLCSCDLPQGGHNSGCPFKPTPTNTTNGVDALRTTRNTNTCDATAYEGLDIDEDFPSPGTVRTYSFPFDDIHRKAQKQEHLIRGAKIRFLDGVEVGSVNVTQGEAFSVAQLSGLPTGCTADSVCSLLSSCGIEVEPIAVRIKPLGVAEVRHRADNLVETVSAVLGLDTSIRVSSLKTGTHKVASTPLPPQLSRSWANTVRCTWLKPSAVARLWFPGDSCSAVEALHILADNSIHGMTPKAHFIAPDSVLLTCLHPSTTESDICNLLDSVDTALPDAVEVIPPPYASSSSEDQGQVVRRLLAKVCTMESWEVLSDPSSRTTTAFARYSSPGVARTVARRIDGAEILEFGCTMVTACATGSIKLEMPARVYDMMEGEMASVKKTLPDARLRFDSTMEHGKGTTSVRISSPDLVSVFRAKKEICKVLGGRPAVSAVGGGNLQWHSFLSRPESMSFLEALQEIHGTFIYRDIKERKLTVYGNNEGVETTLEALRVSLEGEKESVLELTPEQVTWFMQTGSEQLHSFLGAGNAVIAISHQFDLLIQLKIRGVAPAIEHATLLLNAMPEFERDTQDKTECIVCWGEFDTVDTIGTDCGHFYCPDCFSNLCTSTADTGSFPIRCVGDSNLCARVLTLGEIAAGLPSKKFENVLQRSVDSYVRKNTTSYKHCPTPNCDNIYRITHAMASTFSCQNCFATLCTSCGIEHEGMTCDESKDLKAGGEQAFKKWKASKNNVKDCPGCRAVIEKTQGCNHVKCSGCQTHICWVCLEHFETSERCYAHLNQKHGGC